MSEVVWNKYSKEEFNDVMKFSDGYIDFLSDSKTERACVKNAIALAKSYGYRDIKEVIENKEILKAQDKVYVNMMNKSIALMHIGSNPLEKGMNILVLILTVLVWILNKIHCMKMETLLIWTHTIMAVLKSING